MKETFDFIISAFPWIAIGLFVACSCATVKAKADGKEFGRLFKGLCWSPACCFLLLAVTEMYSGNKSRGTTWLVLGVFNAVINFANISNTHNEEK